MKGRVYVDLVGEHTLNTIYTADKDVPKYLVAFHPNGRVSAMVGDLDAAERELENRVAEGKGRWEYRDPEPETIDNEAVQLFAAKMTQKMADSRAKGKSGWNDPVDCPTDFLQRMLAEHVYKGDPVDVANIAMMLDARGASTRLEIHLPLSWQQRVRNEEADLSERLDNLRAFTEDDSFHVIESEDRVLLLQQLAFMTLYRNILRDRIARFTPLT